MEVTILYYPEDWDNYYQPPYVYTPSLSYINIFSYLGDFLASSVFVSLNEHLAAVAKICGGRDADSDGENIKGGSDEE